LKYVIVAYFNLARRQAKLRTARNLPACESCDGGLHAMLALRAIAL
jgi:hypothetical protein